MSGGGDGGVGWLAGSGREGPGGSCWWLAGPTGLQDLGSCCSGGVLPACLAALPRRCSVGLITLCRHPSSTRNRVLDRIEVDVSDGWLQHMRLTAAEPGRAARLLMSGQAAARSGSAGGLMLEGPAAGAGTSTRYADG